MSIINRRHSKPCFSCKGTGQPKPKEHGVCRHCNGYGSIGLKILQQGLKKTNEGKKQ